MTASPCGTKKKSAATSQIINTPGPNSAEVARWRKPRTATMWKSTRSRSLSARTSCEVVCSFSLIIRSNLTCIVRKAAQKYSIIREKTTGSLTPNKSLDLIEQRHEIPLRLVRFANALQVNGEFFIAPQPLHQVARFANIPGCLFICLIIPPVDERFDLSTVNIQSVLRMILFAQRGQFEPEAVGTAAFLRLAPGDFDIPFPEQYAHQLRVIRRPPIPSLHRGVCGDGILRPENRGAANPYVREKPSRRAPPIPMLDHVSPLRGRFRRSAGKDKRSRDCGS